MKKTANKLQRTNWEANQNTLELQATTGKNRLLRTH